MRVRINPYRAGSRSAKLLAEVSGFLRLRSGGSSRFRPRSNDVVINWGDSSCPDFPCRVLNPSTSIINASNKLKAFERFKDAGVSIPRYWTSYDQLPEEPSLRVVGRSVLNGHSGEGITIGTVEDESLCRTAPLYTAYIRKEQEFRLHVVGTSVIFTQRKARRLDHDNPNWQVRNLANGFVFVSHEDAGASAEEQACAAVAALGLDFGACDLVLEKGTGKVYVLEVNTACGLEERTALKYAGAFKEMLNGRMAD